MDGIGRDEVDGKSSSSAGSADEGPTAVVEMFNSLAVRDCVPLLPGPGRESTDLDLPLLAALAY